MAKRSPEKILLQGAESRIDTSKGTYCLESGASRTVDGEEQFYEYKKNGETTIKTRPGPHKFYFGNGTHQSTVAL